MSLLLQAGWLPYWKLSFSNNLYITKI